MELYTGCAYKKITLVQQISREIIQGRSFKGGNYLCETGFIVCDLAHSSRLFANRPVE